jgi:pilus assembly protein CpaC
MHLISNRRRRWIAGLAVLTGLAGSTVAVGQQPKPPVGGVEVKVDAKSGALLVPLGGLAKFDPKTGKLITDITLSNGDVVDARPIAPDLKRIDLVGKLGGATQMSVTYEGGAKAVYTVVVQPDYEQLKFVIKQAVPTATVDIIPGVGNVIVLSGSVTQPGDADIIVRIASSAVGGQASNVINALQIGGTQQVMIDVTVAQVDRTMLRERGFSFQGGGQSFGISSVLNGLAASSATSGTLPTLTTGATANIIAGIVPGQFTGALRALKTEGIAKFLSEPKIVTQTGRAAFFRAGGQQAVLSPSSGINGPGVTLTPIGTELEVLPIVYGDGRIYLEVNPRISSVNNGRGITTAFGFTPGFNEQQVRSSIMLQSGQTFAIGGLLETTVQASAQKVPYLGDLPLLGAAFSSMSHDERETELLILVTPRLVEPLDCSQVPRRVPGKETRSPDDYELFVEQLLEAPRGARKIFENKRFVPAYKHAQNTGTGLTAPSGLVATTGLPGAPIITESPVPPSLPPTVPMPLPVNAPAPLPLPIPEGR